MGGGRGGGRGGRGGRGGYNHIDMGHGRMANGHGAPWQGGREGNGPHSNGPLAPGAFRMVQHGLGSPGMQPGPHGNGFAGAGMRPQYQPQSQQVMPPCIVEAEAVL